MRETGIKQHHSSKSIVQSISLSNYFHFSPPFSLFSNFITIFVAFCIYCHIMDETRSTPKSKEKPLHIFFWSMMNFFSFKFALFRILSHTYTEKKWTTDFVNPLAMNTSNNKIHAYIFSWQQFSYLLGLALDE